LGGRRFQRRLVRVEDETGSGLREQDDRSAGKVDAVNLVTERGVEVAQAMHA
jgi:hypothetical protein